MIQSLIAVILSGLILTCTRKQSLFEELDSADLYVGFWSFLSMFSSNHAIKYVSFPTQVLAKSAKVIPVIIVGSINGVYSFSKKTWVLAFMIAIGLFLFNFANVQGGVQSESLIGASLLMLSLFSDGYYAAT